MVVNSQEETEGSVIVQKKNKGC